MRQKYYFVIGKNNIDQFQKLLNRIKSDPDNGWGLIKFKPITERPGEEVPRLEFNSMVYFKLQDLQVTTQTIELEGQFMEINRGERYEFDENGVPQLKPHRY
jgi:hypothetical protein